MKIKTERQEEKNNFRPIKLNIEIETIGEARLLFHVLNTANLKDIILTDDYKGNGPNWNFVEIEDFKNINGIDLECEILEQGFEV